MASPTVQCISPVIKVAAVWSCPIRSYSWEITDPGQSPINHVHFSTTLAKLNFNLRIALSDSTDNRLHALHKIAANALNLDNHRRQWTPHPYFYVKAFSPLCLFKMDWCNGLLHSSVLCAGVCAWNINPPHTPSGRSARQRCYWCNQLAWRRKGEGTCGGHQQTAFSLAVTR